MQGFRIRVATVAMAAVVGAGYGIGTSVVAGASTSGNTASAPGVTPTSVTVGLVTSLTGPAAANFNGAQQGAAARFALQNSKGGVNGRKLKLAVGDDGSSPLGGRTAVSELIQTKGAFGLLFVSDLVSLGYQVAQQQGVPVVGAAIDGPEWGTKPNTNMVAVSGNQQPNLPVYNNLAKVAKQAGAKNMASLAIANEQPSIVGAQAFATSAKALGLKVGYENYSIPIGSVDVTSVVLGMKQAHVDGFASYMLDTTNFAIMSAAKQAGLKLVAPIQFVGYDQALLDSPTDVSAAQGAIFSVAQVPFEEKTAATKREQAAFVKYEHFSGVPNLNWTYGWLSADLFIKGLQAAGKNPTRTSLLNALHKTKGWTAGGLLATAPDLSLANFGHSPSKTCGYFVKLSGTKFVPVNKGKPVCGTLVKP